MNYQKIYNQLIEKRVKFFPLFKSSEQYCEQHHIVPRCLNGTDDPLNLVNLTAREHFIAHVLLMKIYPNDIRLSSAVQIMMKRSLDIRKINSKKYEFIRQEIAKTKSIHQSALCWIRNIQKNIQTFWPKNTQLTINMINDGWEFGRLPTDKCGYKAGKFIRITNDIEDKYISKDDIIPAGWRRGMSQKNKQHQSDACKGRKGTTTGKKCIINNNTQQVKYIDSTTPLPDGWRYGSPSYGKHRAMGFGEKLSKSLTGKKRTLATKQKLSNINKGYKWYTNGIISLRIKADDIIPAGFERGRILKNNKYEGCGICTSDD